MKAEVLKAVIADDEELARGILREYIEREAQADEPGIEIVAECANGFEAVKAMASKARSENERLEARIAELEARLAPTQPVGGKPVS